MKILSVEDSSDLQLLYRTVIEASGHECLCAETAHKARELIESQSGSLDLILMDLTLPDLEAADFESFFSSIPGFDQIPLIVSSGRDDVKKWGEKLGAMQAWKKPVDVREFRQFLKGLHQGPSAEPSL